MADEPMDAGDALTLDDFADLLSLAQAWTGRDPAAASLDERAALVRRLEPRFDDLNAFLEDQPAPAGEWPPDLQALNHLAQLFDVLAFEDEVWERAFPNGPSK